MSEFGDDLIERIVSRYPPAEEITPAEFEAYVADVIEAVGAQYDTFAVERHAVIVAADGNYDFDAVASFEVGGMTFRVLVEAKRHSNPIKRELVQALHTKQQSVGAQKSILVAAGRFQAGAIRFAFAHGIALATLSEGRLMYETRASTPTIPISTQFADELGWESYAAMTSTKSPDGTIRGFRLAADYGEGLAEWIRE